MDEDKVVELDKVESPKETLSEMDRLALELAKSRKQTAQATAEKALAQHETSDLAYKYVVLQLYMKYGLTEVDALNESGEILRGGAAKAVAEQAAGK